MMARTAKAARRAKQKPEDRFEAVAKRLGCDDGKKTFEAKLGKIAGAKLKTPAKRIKRRKK